jgi:hypothetical protein
MNEEENKKERLRMRPDLMSTKPSKLFENCFECPTLVFLSNLKSINNFLSSQNILNVIKNQKKQRKKEK